jgi:hypothetical protein
MVKLTLLNSVSRWEARQVSDYPEIEEFITMLKNIIRENPGAGLYDPILSETGKKIPCRKRSVNIFLFSNRYAIGYSHITAHYLYSNNEAVIIKMRYT